MFEVTVHHPGMRDAPGLTHICFMELLKCPLTVLPFHFWISYFFISSKKKTNRPTTDILLYAVLLLSSRKRVNFELPKYVNYQRDL